MTPKDWTTTKPSVPGVYFRRNFVIGRPNEWRIHEVARDLDGALRVSTGTSFENAISDWDLLENYSEDQEWFGPLGPMPDASSRHLPLRSLREFVRECNEVAAELSGPTVSRDDVDEYWDAGLSPREAYAEVYS